MISAWKKYCLWGGLLLVLLPALLLPLVPQKDLHRKLAAVLSRSGEISCRLEQVRLHLLPRPALVADNLDLVRDLARLKIKRLRIAFSWLSLFQFQPRPGSVSVQGFFLETPAAMSLSEAEPCLPVWLLNELKADPELKSLALVWRQGLWRIADFPTPGRQFLLSDLSGKWQRSKGNRSQICQAQAEIGGGRADLRLTRYLAAEAAVLESSEADPAAEVEKIDLNFAVNGFSARAQEALPVTIEDFKGLLELERASLSLQADGVAAGGLRFSAGFSAAGHHLLGAAGENGTLISQGPLQLAGKGFFQRRKAYLNLKNATLTIPEVGVLFSRGLFRFDKPAFVDLVSEFKVDDLGGLAICLPALMDDDFNWQGSGEGDLQLLGDPFSHPVLRVNLQMPDLQVDEKTPRPQPLASAAPENLPPADAESAPAGNSRDRILGGLSQVAAADWQGSLALEVDDCRLWGRQFHDFFLSAEKDLVKIEVERLAAGVGEKGNFRLSLILDELLRQPRWQASLVVEELPLDEFFPKLKCRGRLGTALVGEGRLHDSAGDLWADSSLKGRWRLDDGCLDIDYPFLSRLRDAFNEFFFERGMPVLAGSFNQVSGRLQLGDQSLRLDGLRMTLDAKRALEADGRFDLKEKKYAFRGRWSAPPFPPFLFNLTGDGPAPLFSAR